LRSDSERFSADGGYFYPVIPAQAGIQEFAAQAGIQEFDQRTGSRQAKGRRLCADINAYAAKRLMVLKAPLRRQQIKPLAMPGGFDSPFAEIRPARPFSRKCPTFARRHSD
jgi:hypothetical protein